MRRKNSRPQNLAVGYNFGVKRLHFEEFAHGLQIVSVFAENVFDLLVGRIRYCGKVAEARDIYKAVFSEHTHINRHWRTVDYGIYGVADIGGNTERFGKIVCGAERNESERNILAELHNSGNGFL